MTWRWWLFAAILAITVEFASRTHRGYGVWADHFALALLFVAGTVVIARRLKQ